MGKLISFIKENRTITLLTTIVVIHYIYFLFGFSSNGGINENFYMDNNITLEKKGVWGDFSSGHFSILAFLWLAYGVYLQRQELNEQKKQFEEQKALNEQQMKELEIQSIQNQFDRKIVRLTAIEKEIAQTLDRSIHGQNGLYIFFLKCRHGEFELIKIDMIYIYLELYNNLLNFVKSSQEKINLMQEFDILKKDIYINMKISFILLLACSHVRIKNDEINKFFSLKIYQDILNLKITNVDQILTVIKNKTHNFQNIDDIDIFEKAENT